MASTIQTDVPLVNVPFVDLRTGMVAETWFLFLIQLWRRTGGASGTIPESLTIQDVLALETVFSLGNLSQQLQSLALAVEQLQADRQQDAQSVAMSLERTQLSVQQDAQSVALAVEQVQTLRRQPDDLGEMVMGHG
jgi:hypothetical protein